MMNENLQQFLETSDDHNFDSRLKIKDFSNESSFTSVGLPIMYLRRNMSFNKGMRRRIKSITTFGKFGLSKFRVEKRIEFSSSRILLHYHKCFD